MSRSPGSCIRRLLKINRWIGLYKSWGMPSADLPCELSIVSYRHFLTHIRRLELLLDFVEEQARRRGAAHVWKNSTNLREIQEYRERVHAAMACHLITEEKKAHKIEEGYHRLAREQDLEKKFRELEETRLAEEEHQIFKQLRKQEQARVRALQAMTLAQTHKSPPDSATTVSGFNNSTITGGVHIMNTANSDGTESELWITKRRIADPTIFSTSSKNTWKKRG